MGTDNSGRGLIRLEYLDYGQVLQLHVFGRPFTFRLPEWWDKTREDREDIADLFKFLFFYHWNDRYRTYYRKLVLITWLFIVYCVYIHQQLGGLK